MSVQSSLVPIWQCGSFVFPLGKGDSPVVMGVINTTPDSFSDGGRYLDAAMALTRAEQLLHDGARIIDVGGESTRPGSLEVSVEEEIARVIPVVSALAKAGHCVSIDTKKADVMRAALDAGASIVNDVMALTAPGALEVCAAYSSGIVLMHMQGAPETMQSAPHYASVVDEVKTYLLRRAQACEAAGIARSRLVLDPGFGFGKTISHNIALTHSLSGLVETGYGVLAGWSRKRTIGELTGRAAPQERVNGSVAAALACVARGARIVRVHDVRETVDAIKVWQAMGGEICG